MTFYPSLTERWSCTVHPVVYPVQYPVYTGCCTYGYTTVGYCCRDASTTLYRVSSLERVPSVASPEGVTRAVFQVKNSPGSPESDSHGLTLRSGVEKGDSVLLGTGVRKN